MREKILSIRPIFEMLFVTTLTFGLSGLSYIFNVIAYGHIAFPVFKDSTLLKGTAWQIILLLLIAFFLKFRNWSFQDFPFRVTVIGAAGGLGLVATFYITYVFAFNLLSWVIDSNALININGFRTHLHLSTILIVCLVNPVFEEFITLGYLIKALESHGCAVAVGVSTFLRLFVHLYQGPLAVVGILPLGILFAMCYWRFRNLWPFVFAHFFLDLIPLLRLA